jgi:hypothetical protein
MQTLGTSTDQKKRKYVFFLTKTKKRNVSFTKKRNVDIPSYNRCNGYACKVILGDCSMHMNSDGQLTS